MSYKTIKEFSKNEFIEKKSRFIGYITPVKTEKQAQEFIETISKKHYDATHNVYAFVLQNGDVRRYSDNGEPQGTAGIPTLDVILKEGLVDVCVVITRYFGGVMLGGGGLVRAYSHSAKIAIDSAQILEMVDCYDVSVSCEYTMYGKLNYILPDFDVKILETDFSDNVRIKFRIKKDLFNMLEKKVVDLSGGRINLDIITQGFDNF